MLTIANRLKSALDSISTFAQDAKRDPHTIRLLAVSKTKPNEAIKEAYNAGQRMFGENYVQEGIQKVQELKDLTGIEWHFIGPLQSNKTRVVAEHFDWVQSIERTKIADRLNEQRPSEKGSLQVCIQVNISEEENKSGVSPNDVLALAAHIDTLPNLTLRGLMAIPANTDSEAQQKQAFNAMQSLYHTLQNQYANIDTLSIGMSGDMKAAIECGSSMVRIGTAIFGAREKKQ